MGPPVSLRFRSRVLTLAGSFLVGLGACGDEQKPEANASRRRLFEAGVRGVSEIHLRSGPT